MLSNSHNPAFSARSFTSPSTQSSLHSIALNSLPPPTRKQNAACDTCRSRKVKCVPVPGQEKCQHCLLKNATCTHHVQLATNERRRGSYSHRRRLNSASAFGASTLNSVINTSSGSRDTSLKSTTVSPAKPLQPPTLAQRSTSQLISFLLSPYEPATAYYRFGSQYEPSESADQPSPEDWGEIGVKLQDEAYRTEFATDLVEVYFQICHTRLPLLNPSQFRLRFLSSLPLHIASALSISHTTSALAFNVESYNPVHPAMLATVMAWGAKFSEHPIIVQDREQSNGRSRIARTLLMKAREVAEAEKIHRIPTADHVIISLLLEPLQSHNTNDPDGFHNFWVSCAVRHLFELGINHRSTTENIMDSDTKGTLKLAFWVATLADAYGAVFFRKKPILEDEDYNIELLDDPITENSKSNHHQGVPATAQSQFRAWYVAAHAMARCVRDMSRQLWRPTTEAEGVSYAQLSEMVEPLYEWRDEYLVKVGVPSNLQADWDFVAAVSACSSDAQYHVMWVILHNAIEEFGIREFNEAQNADLPLNSISNLAQIENLKEKVADEAVHGAIRIAGLAGVLTSNGYLRLDPNVLHFAVYTAGILLARLGKSEVQNCIAGLRQYGFAYEEAFDQAIEMERLYNLSIGFSVMPAVKSTFYSSTTT